MSVFSHSETTGAISAAIVKAQSQMQAAKKDAANPFFRSKYADLASVAEVAKVPLAENGLAIISGAKWSGVRVAKFARKDRDDNVRVVEAEVALIEVETRLIHESGEWYATTLSCEAIGVGPQEVGSAITYLRRYGKLAILDIATEDDDGEAGQGRRNDLPPPPVAQPKRKSEYKLPQPPGDSMAFSAGFEGVVGHIDEKKGKSTGKPFWVVTIDSAIESMEFRTFDTKHHETALRLHKAGEMAKVTYSVDQYGNKITSIEAA